MLHRDRKQRQSSPTGTWSLWVLAILTLSLAGCTTSFFRKRADNQVYDILEDKNQAVTGSTNAVGLYNINTDYSTRPPESVLPAELIQRTLSGTTDFLTINDALEVAAARSRQYQTEKEQLYIAALNLTGARHLFSPRFLGSVAASGDRLSDGERRGRVNSRLSVGQMMLSGADFGLRIANDLLKYYTGNSRRQAISVISADLFQPLLRGAGRKVAAENLLQSERDVVYAIRDFSHFQNTFSVNVVVDYFRLLQQKENIANRYANFLARSNATVRIRERAVDRETQLDVGQAEQAELSAKNQYINSITAYQNSLDRFKINIGLPVTTSLHLDDTALDDLKDLGIVDIPINPEDCYVVAVNKQYPTLNAIDRFEDRKRKIVVAANRLKADLNIVASASLDSEGPTDYAEFDVDQISASAGLELNLPLDRLNERNQYRAVLIQFESEIRALTLALDNLKSRLDQGVRGLYQFRQNYEIQLKAKELADNRVASTILFVQAGRATQRDLNEALDDQVAAQNGVIGAQVDYLEARLDLALEMGILSTDEDNFWLTSSLTSLPTQNVNPLMETESVPTPEEIFSR